MKVCGFLEVGGEPGQSWAELEFEGEEIRGLGFGGGCGQNSKNGQKIGIW